MLAYCLAELLKELEIQNLILKNIKIKISRGNLLQQIALEVLKGKCKISLEKEFGNVFYRCFRIGIGSYNGKDIGYSVIRGKDVDIIKKLREYLSKQPKFVIDLSFWKEHSKKEKKRLKLQVYQSAGTINDFLYHRTNLILVNSPTNEFLEFVKSDRTFYERIEDRRVIILDPNADKSLNESIIQKTEYFLIGGIVDVGTRWERATEILFKEIPFERRKITLEDSIKGVPDRINSIIGILLDVLYGNLSLREAILKRQTIKDVLSRISFEIHKYPKEITISELINLGKSVNRHPRELVTILEKYFNRKVLNLINDEFHCY